MDDRRFLTWMALAVLLVLPTPPQSWAAGVLVEALDTPDPNVIALSTNELVHAEIVFDGEFGVTGSDLRVVGLPQGWLLSASPNPSAASAVGNIMSSGGILSFESCQTLRTLFYSMTIFATSNEFDVMIYLDGSEGGNTPPFDCAVVYRCDGPVFTRVCVGSIGLCINSSCLLPVEETTWASVKAMYGRE